MKFIGTKTLETDRLILRRATLADADVAYQSWCTSDAVAKYVMWEKHKNVDETRAIYTKWLEAYQDLDTYRWIAELKDTGEVIGTIDISKKFLPYGTCEVGYCYAEKYWGQGYGTEILTRVIKFLFASSLISSAIYVSALKPSSTAKILSYFSLKILDNLSVQFP